MRLICGILNCQNTQKRDPVERLVDVPWWISVALAAVAYVTFAFVLPSLELPSIPWVPSPADFFRNFAPFIAWMFLSLAALSVLLSLHKRKQREQTQRELLEVYRVMETERIETDSMKHTEK